MKLELKSNVYYETFNTKEKLQEKILSMIMISNTDKILYKGNPTEIDYKMMKKVLLQNYTQKYDPEIIKKKYKDIINSSSDRKYCLIYKEK